MVKIACRSGFSVRNAELYSLLGNWRNGVIETGGCSEMEITKIGSWWEAMEHSVI